MNPSYHYIADTIEHINHDMKNMARDDFEQSYGITFEEDGSVTDLTYDKVFDSVDDWIKFEAEADAD